MREDLRLLQEEAEPIGTITGLGWQGREREEEGKGRGGEEGRKGAGGEGRHMGGGGDRIAFLGYNEHLRPCVHCTYTHSDS